MEFDTFEAYCREKWQYGRHYVNRLILAAQVFTHLVTISHQRRPEHETQVRPLIGLTPPQAQLAWEHAVEKAAGKKITQRLVKAAVQELQLGGSPAPVTQQPRRNKAEQRRLVDKENMMIGHNKHQKAAAPLTQLLGVDHVDMREYHGHIGDLIRIDAFSLFKMDKVLVAIRAEKAGVIERGLARPDPTTNQWLYTATAENPEKEAPQEPRPNGNRR